MEFDKLVSSIQRLAPWLDGVDIVQFALLGFGLHKFLGLKKDITDDLNKNYLSVMSESIKLMSESIGSIKLELVRHTVMEESQFATLKKDLHQAEEFRSKLMTTIERIESTQERHTFMFEGQNSEMYAGRMHNIKQRAREFFADWKNRLHKRLLTIDYDQSIDNIFPEFFKHAMEDLAEWTVIFRTKIHPTHMSIIENEVNPTILGHFAENIKTRLLPALKDIWKDANFEKKSFDVCEIFLDKTNREWEDLMEITFRSKRAKSEI